MLTQRIWQHHQKFVKSFTEKYNINKLVYFEVFDSIQEAIQREKYIKGKVRKYKKDLIEKNNPEYGDLFKDIL